MCQLVAIKTNDNKEIYVADIKKKAIENIIVSAPQCKQISEIILFGSSLEERCTHKSDIDLAIISERDVTGLSKIKSFDKFMNRLYDYDAKQEYDRVYFKSMKYIEEKKEQIQICKELLQKGKIIYRRLS